MQETCTLNVVLTRHTPGRQKRGVRGRDETRVDYGVQVEVNWDSDESQMRMRKYLKGRFEVDGWRVRGWALAKKHEEPKGN